MRAWMPGLAIFALCILFFGVVEFLLIDHISWLHIGKLKKVGKSTQRQDLIQGKQIFVDPARGGYSPQNDLWSPPVFEKPRDTWKDLQDQCDRVQYQYEHSIRDHETTRTYK
jgi:hypothetical protein